VRCSLSGCSITSSWALTATTAFRIGGSCEALLNYFFLVQFRQQKKACLFSFATSLDSSGVQFTLLEIKTLQRPSSG
jgi:hypothetical protein